jgi:hypothetical protein
MSSIESEIVDLEERRKKRAEELAFADRKLATVTLVRDRFYDAVRLDNGEWGSPTVVPTHFDVQAARTAHWNCAPGGIQIIHIAPCALYAEFDTNAGKARVYSLDRVDVIEAFDAFQAPGNERTLLECLKATTTKANAAYLDGVRAAELEALKKDAKKGK